MAWFRPSGRRITSYPGLIGSVLGVGWGIVVFITQPGPAMNMIGAAILGALAGYVSRRWTNTVGRCVWLVRGRRNQDRTPNQLGRRRSVQNYGAKNSRGANSLCSAARCVYQQRLGVKSRRSDLGATSPLSGVDDDCGRLHHQTADRHQLYCPHVLIDCAPARGRADLCDRRWGGQTRS